MEMMKLTEKDIRIIGELAGDPERLDKQDYKNVTVQALVAEIERQREEIAALRRFVQALIKEGARTPDDVDYAEYVESYERAMGERPDAPAPEPAPHRPRLGDTLVNAITEGKRIIVKETGERGVVFKIFYSEIIQARQYRIEFTNGEYCDYDRDEIELAPAEPTPAEPAPEIKKGDKVGVIRAHGHGDKKLIGLEGVVTEIREGEELTYRYTVKIGERRHFLARDQIIPLTAY